MSASAEAEPGRQETILVVDDNDDNLALARHTLEDEGYAVVLASNGQAGLEAFTTRHPDCVILDIRMPGMDGFSVCEHIRKLPEGAAVPVLFLTALRDIDTFDHALRAGGDDFLTKPVRPAELVVRVATALKLRRMRTELHGHYELLKRQRDDLMRLGLQKERLMAFVVHDLKNPVNSMDLHAQIVLRDPGVPHDARQSVAQIRTEARHLNRMILNLLDISKADEGRLTADRVEVDLARLYADVSAELEASAHARGVSLEARLACGSVRADTDLLRRTLANLVENGIRHAPAKSTVTVSSARVDGATEIHVTDAGPGVPAAMRETIFQPFVQLSGADLPPTRAGRGLGLAFCKLAALAHGGRVWVADASPGARFSVRIPDEVAR
jgi:signal transduction histidine kinase